MNGAEASGAAPRISVILSAYRQERELALVLRAYAQQQFLDFELLVADDGSGPETKALLDAFAGQMPVPLRHIWQPDRGFRKAEACNRAALASRGRWLLFSDGDCVPTRSLLAVHAAAARQGAFVVGGQIPLTRAQSEQALRASDSPARVLQLPGLRQRAEPWRRHVQALYYIAIGARRRPKFYGRNFSLSREDFVALNGFDHRFGGHGQEDSDLRNRMRAAGMRAISRWPSARVHHLWHPRHPERGGSPELAAWYRRRDPDPVAERGLRQLADEDVATASRGEAGG